MIAAMTEIVNNAIAATVLLAALITLVRYARHDSFAAPGTGHQPHDEFGPLAHRRRPA
jgi:hypothetical protein